MICVEIIIKIFGTTAEKLSILIKTTTFCIKSRTIASYLEIILKTNKHPAKCVLIELGN